MPDYQNGKIYKITGTTDDGQELIYIGSTIQKLCVRFASHKNDMKRGKNYSSKQLVICSNCLITLIELFPCNSKEELLMRERYYYDLYDCVNKVKPILLEGEKKEYKKQYYKQYNIENVDKIKEYSKQYCIENADKIKEDKKQYRIENSNYYKEYNKQYRIENTDKVKEYFKQHYIENVDKIKEYRKNYRIENIDKLKEQRRQYYLRKKQEQKQEIV